MARFGGEEFAILLPDADASDVKSFSELIVTTVRKAAIPHLSSEISEKIVTISAGCATIVSEGNDDESEKLIEYADKALYKAKHGGRNRVWAGGM